MKIIALVNQKGGVAYGKLVIMQSPPHSMCFYSGKKAFKLCIILHIDATKI